METQSNPVKGTASQDLHRKRDRAATEERLLAAAENIFSRLGFKAATTKLISQQSGVNESLIARYFNGKSGLLFAILEKRIEDTTNRELSYPAQSTVEDELAMYAKFAVDQYRQRTCIMKIVVTQTLVDEDFNRRLRDLLPTAINKELSKRMNALADDGKIGRRSEIFRILDGLGVHIFGYILMRVVMLGEQMDQAADVLQKHALDCARLLKS